jgi:bifunctional DNA-binding transcriptional regulator/antitoxin component of YhaV-PrlF toxin-antitoxin module
MGKGTVVVSRDFRVLIPRWVRRQLGIRQSQRLRTSAVEGRVEFIPIVPAKSRRGFLEGIDTTVPRDLDRI